MSDRLIASTEVRLLREEVAMLRAAIQEHHGQKADDRCVEDDDRLYAAAGLPPCDRRVGDQAAMLENCRRFIERRCEGGGWPTYRDLETALQSIAELDDRSANMGPHIARRALAKNGDA